MRASSRRAVTLWELLRYFIVLGVTGFGGPIALSNAMRRDLVDARAWISPDEYEEGLAIATACPGPLAYQLGVYCGYILHGLEGAIGVAVAFAAGPCVLVTAAAYVYVHYSASWELRSVFYGVGPVVVALIVKSCWDLGRKTLRAQKMAWTFAAIASFLTIVLQKELVGIFLVAGVIGVIVFAGPPGAKPSSDRSVFRPEKSTLLSAGTTLVSVAGSPLFLFFFKTGLLVFGSGLVIVPFLKSYVVDQYHWLDNRTFLDSVAVGMISPGPVVITATFVGYLLGGLPGSAAATAGIFLPSVLFTIAGTPLLRRHRANPQVQGFIRGVTVAVVGVLAGTAFLVFRTTVNDAVTQVVFVTALCLAVFARRIPEQALVALAAVLGLMVGVPGQHR